MATGAPLPLLPRKFGRYALFDYIGKGGMAEIYLARARTELGASRLCVVKQVLPELASQPRFAEMLIHEAKLAARLNHANIVQVFDLGRSDERLYIAMDYVEGFDLNDLLRRCTRAKVPLPFEFALRIVADALRGLDYAHRRVDDAGKPLGIVHRDVSPSNVLLSFEGEVRVCDFGIARANDAFGDALVDDAIKGKAGYMSPEHARGEALDARADVFAVGILMWELVTGRRMYRVDGGKPLLEQARAAEIPELPDRGLPNQEGLYAIVRRALSVDKADRFPSAQAMLAEIEGYMVDAKLMGSSLRFGEWMVEKFAEDIVQQRRARERAVDALERGAPVSLVPLPPAPTPLPSMAPPAAPAEPASGASLSHISSTPPPTPLPLIPRAPPRASVEPPSSLRALDVSPPSSQLARKPPPPPPPSRLPFVLVIVLVFLVAFGVAIAVFLKLLH